jgi:hypothetical protein
VFFATLWTSGISQQREARVETRREELFSTSVAAGSRTYFFDVKESVKGDKYLTISESRRDDEGDFEHNRVMVFEEHVGQFLVGLKQAALTMAPSQKAYSVEQIRQQHPMAYARWTEAEMSDLRRLHEDGKTIDELA